MPTAGLGAGRTRPIASVQTGSPRPARGEVHLVSDTDEVLLRAGDTAVVRGVNHAWSNRSNEPALIVGVMPHAKPLPKELYPAPGL